MQFKFLKNNLQNKRFDYAPMFYDERREKLELKKMQYQKLKDKDLSIEERQQLLRNNMREGWSQAAYRQKVTSTSNLRILILIALLVGLGYFIFNGVDEVDTVVKKLM
jgi:lipopolysaccharide export LptBFGC system permease protein LptF